ncbi:MAG: hypothetical protein M0029_08055 [Actinomycetota bacterium]|jgi:hypothetical protein|nr:hypothetical protein [Actinomycetota bacterium]
MTAVVEAGIAHGCDRARPGPSSTRPVRGCASGTGAWHRRLHLLEPDAFRLFP